MIHEVNPQSSIITQQCPEFKLAVGHFMNFLVGIWSKNGNLCHCDSRDGLGGAVFFDPGGEQRSLTSPVQGADAARSLSVSENIMCNTSYSANKKLSELAWQASHSLSEKNALSPNGRNFSWKGKENVSSLMTKKLVNVFQANLGSGGEERYLRANEPQVLPGIFSLASIAWPHWTA